MEPVEINAGALYLRQLRADDLIDDRPAILSAFLDAVMLRWVPGYRVVDLDSAEGYVALRALEWAQDQRCSWAVAEPTTGELLGEVGLKDLSQVEGVAEASCWTHPAHRGRGVAALALTSVVNFGFGALDLHRVDYKFAEGNEPSRRVAEKCGFTPTGRYSGATVVDGVAGDLLVWSRTR